MESGDITMVRHAFQGHAGHTVSCLRVDRWTLAKTRWRGKAEDGKEFGFDLEHPLSHGDLIADGYKIEQLPEPVFVIPVDDARQAASLAWSIGNLHQLVQVADGELIVADDPGIRKLVHATKLPHRSETRIFQPLRSHGIHHHHH